MEHTWDESYDVVVVGSGTGLMAAMTAAKNGLSTIVVEKTEVFGGSTAMSGGGMWMPNASVIERNGAVDTPQRVETYLDHLCGDDSPRERRSAFVKYAPVVADAIERYTPLELSHMPEYADYYSDVEGGSAIGRSVEAKPFDVKSLGDDAELVRSGEMEAPVPMPVTSVDYKWMNLMRSKPVTAFPKITKRLVQGVGGMALKREYVAGGLALAAGLYAGAKAAGVTLRNNAGVTELIKDGDRVVGVVVNSNGKDVRINAKKAVILANGGFDRNMEMRHKYQSEHLEDGWQFGNPGATGEVHKMAESIGAELVLMDQTWWFPAIKPVSKDAGPAVLLAERSLPGSLIVDKTGHRFMNESIDYMRAGKTILGMDDGEEPHLPAWLIFDKKYRDSYVLGGGVMPGMPLPKEWYEAGIAFKADTIQELAAKIGVDGLPDGVKHFNVLAAQANDDDFQRGNTHYDRYYGDPTNTPNPCLRPLGKGPYYAIEIVPGDLGTCGGVSADEYGRALTPSGEPIEGLYAIGNAAGNAFGKVYPGAGATIGQGVVFGYIAALHAAGKLN